VSRLVLPAAVVLVLLPDLVAQDRKQPKGNGPRVTVAQPLGVAPGTAVRVKLRGLKLDAATEVRFFEPKTVTRVLAKRKAGVPNGQEVGRVGDTELEVEVILPPDVVAESLAFVVVTPDGESPPHRLLVNDDTPVVVEREPNNGFEQAQPIQVPQAIDGVIGQPQDVDVFAFAGQAGQRLVFEILAARHGSALDSILTVYDAAGHELARNDDMAGNADSRLAVTLPQTGRYFLCVQDAHDQGGPAHVNRLVVRSVK
jgi:hypothetical protein